MTLPDLASLPTLRQTGLALREGQLTVRTLLEQTQSAAQAHAALNALAWVDWDAARREADAMDSKAASGQPLGVLHGACVSIKDLYVMQGAPTQGGTRARLPDLGPEGPAVSRLRAAGALLFAKTNLHEVALGGTGENSWTGDVLNPHDPAHQAGGSSSGAGAAVAAGIGVAGLGSDTGGSVRIPAAFCGTVGFKPTWGAIPLQGALCLSWTCDHAGPLTRNVDDAALLYEVMSGRRTDHGHVARRPRLGIPAQWLAGRLGVQTRSWFEALCARLSVQADLVEINPAVLPQAWAAYTPLVRAEAAWVHRDVLAAGGEGFSVPVLTPLKLGLEVSLPAYFESLRMRSALCADLDAALRDVDALIAPTTAVPAPRRGQLEVEVESGRVATRDAVLGMTAPFSFAGLPTLSLPAGRIGHLPASLQVVGARDADAALLALGRWLEPQIR
ncbi:MAG: Glutamyl-tRNA(Gln) amidotransferase subunit [Pseudomonadota bacterium]|jgi:aspartyl-tRNA(Asn)/glutamyl-tRNA(Gln) amidotransferase subunit A